MSNCDHCRWFVRKDAADTHGLCRRRAPSPRPPLYGWSPNPSQWPTVSSSDFCGDYEPTATSLSPAQGSPNATERSGAVREALEALKAFAVYEGLCEMCRQRDGHADDCTITRLAALSPSPVPPSGDERLQEIVAFLLGEATLDGVWFGDPGDRKPYWWRTHLRAVLTERGA